VRRRPRNPGCRAVARRAGSSFTIAVQNKKPRRFCLRGRCPSRYSRW